MLNLISVLVDQHGLTMLFVSHDLTVVRHVCDSVAVLRQGQLVESGPIAQVYDSPQHDYTRQLLASVPKLPSFEA